MANEIFQAVVPATHVQLVALFFCQLLPFLPHRSVDFLLMRVERRRLFSCLLVLLLVLLFLVVVVVLLLLLLLLLLPLVAWLLRVSFFFFFVFFLRGRAAGIIGGDAFFLREVWEVECGVDVVMVHHGVDM